MPISVRPSALKKLNKRNPHNRAPVRGTDNGDRTRRLSQIGNICQFVLSPSFPTLRDVRFPDRVARNPFGDDLPDLEYRQ